MSYKHGNTQLSLDQIQFLTTFLTGKPISLFYPKTLFNLLNTPGHINTFKKHGLSFPLLKQYLDLINSHKLHASLPHSLLFRLFNGRKIEAKKHNILYIRT